MQCVRNVSSLNHLRHVGSVLSCAAHVNGKGAIQSSDTLMIQEVKRVAARSTRGGNFSSVGLREETLPEQKSRWLGNPAADVLRVPRSEEHTSELQSRLHLVCRLLLEKKNDLLRWERQLRRLRGRQAWFWQGLRDGVVARGLRDRGDFENQYTHGSSRSHLARAGLRPL